MFFCCEIFIKQVSRHHVLHQFTCLQRLQRLKASVHFFWFPHVSGLCPPRSSIPPSIHAPSSFPPRGRDLITELAGVRLTSPPPPVLLCSCSCLSSLLHLYPSPSPLFCSPLLVLSSSPSSIPVAGALGDLPGGHHGNLHPLLEPLGDPVRPPWVT